MAKKISPRVRFRKQSMRALMLQIDGQEPPYPVYYFGSVIKFERPERPGKPYRWTKDIVIP